MYVISIIIQLLTVFKGSHFGTTEATETFFAMTKLFQSRDVSTIRVYSSLHFCGYLQYFEAPPASEFLPQL